jgi:DUF1680 family protein
MTVVSRRTFLHTAASATAAVCAHGASPRAAAQGQRGSVAITLPLSTFAYADVKLLAGPMKRQFDENHARFLNLDDDRMLKVYRQVAGLRAPGEDMGGWYDISTDFRIEPRNFHGFIAGHSFGQYLSALARAYAVTGDEATRAKVGRLVKGYAETLDPKAKFFDGYRLPAYTYDKTLCGLIDAHEYTRDPMALDVLEKLTRAVMVYLPEKALSRDEQRARLNGRNESFSWDESYTLPENLFLAYQRSGNTYYRDLAKRFLQDDTYFDPLVRGENPLPGKHAYSHVNAFSSAMQAYVTLGSEKHLDAAKKGFERVLTEQSYATGGWGPDEGFREPNKGQLGETLRRTHQSFETPCGAYGHFKIARYLLRTTKESRYGDSMERVLYNTILGAWPIQADGTSFYYSDYGMPGKKSWYTETWPCCSGTFPQLAADYHISTYLRAPDGVYVNLFTPSSVHWTVAGAKCSLTQDTTYPIGNTVTMKVSASRAVETAVYVRIPSWASPAPILSVNGRRMTEGVTAGTFAAIRRAWREGDVIELELSMPLRLEAVDTQHAKDVALLRGPLVMFAIAESQPAFERAELLRSKPVAGTPGELTATTADGKPLVFRPFMKIDKETYITYQMLKA